jgi:EAL domain-containing protein (putative c-di-GMP-specific phosphodiesterase class I)
MGHPASVAETIFVDEVGIEIGLLGDFRLKSAYQPIFRREGAELRPVAVEGKVAPFLEGRAVAATEFLAKVAPDDRLFVESLCNALHLRNHHNVGLPWLELFVSYHPRGNGEFLREMAALAEILDEIELDPRLVVCEISEAAALDQQTLQALASEIRRHGMRVSIGDFSHSPGGQVGGFRPDIVKIEGAWFRRLCEDDGTARLFAPVAATFRQLGAQILVGGIETVTQLRVAIDGQADLLQGRLLARPALAGTIFEEEALSLDRLLDFPGKVVPLFGKHQRR